jgi:hypothetical protein
MWLTFKQALELCGKAFIWMRANGVGINGSRAELGMAEPFLHQVERDAGGDGGYPETVPQPFGRGRHTLQPGGLHHCMHRPPTGHPRPRPEPRTTPFAAPCVQLADAADNLDRGERHGYCVRHAE